MGLLVRSAGGRPIFRVLVLQFLLLHGAILSSFSSVTTAAASRLHERWGSRDPEMQLQGSLARYRQLLQNDDDSKPDLVKPEEPEISAAHEEFKQETEKNADGAVQNPDVDESKAVQTVDEPEGSPEEKQSQEPEETAPDKTRDPNLDGEKLDEKKDHQTEEKNQPEEPKVDNIEKAETEVEVEPTKEAKNEEPQSTGENEKKEPEVQQNEHESESNSQDQQQGEERQETQKSESKTEEVKLEEEKPVEEEPFVFPEPYLLGPTIKDWDEQRAGWLESNPHMKTLPDGKPRVLIVTGSQPKPCHSATGDHFHLKNLKLKIDYARIHKYEIYYNFVWLDPLFDSYWVKLPTVRKLMLTHPEIEWFIWIDSDAIFTDMLFEAPFDTYEGINMVMWGYHQGFYVDKSWVAFNAGVFLIRNCQWSLNLIDKWSPMGPSGPVRDEYGKILSSFLSWRPQNYAADDQSALAYLMLTDEAVNSKVKLVDLGDYMISAWWVEVVNTYETLMEKYHPGLGNPRWPWITHFTGCGPCNGNSDRNPQFEECKGNMTRALNFADNQVLAYMGFQHESLTSDSVIRIRNETDRPLDLVGVNPWAERIAQLASAAA